MWRSCLLPTVESLHFSTGSCDSELAVASQTGVDIIFLGVVFFVAVERARYAVTS
jgi:hypothetical protein